MIFPIRYDRIFWSIDGGNNDLAWSRGQPATSVAATAASAWLLVCVVVAGSAVAVGDEYAGMRGLEN